MLIMVVYFCYYCCICESWNKSFDIMRVNSRIFFDCFCFSEVAITGFLDFFATVICCCWDGFCGCLTVCCCGLICFWGAGLTCLTGGLWGGFGCNLGGGNCCCCCWGCGGRICCCCCCGLWGWACCWILTGSCPINLSL